MEALTSLNGDSAPGPGSPQGPWTLIATESTMSPFNFYVLGWWDLMANWAGPVIASVDPGLFSARHTVGVPQMFAEQRKTVFIPVRLCVVVPVAGGLRLVLLHRYCCRRPLWHHVSGHLVS